MAGHFSEEMFIRLEPTPKQNALKTNFRKIKRSEIKTLVTNHFLDKYSYKVLVKNKQLQINSIPYTFILLHCLLFFLCLFYLYPSQYFSFSLFLPFFSPSSSSFFTQKRTRSDLKSCMLISLKFGCQHCIRQGLLLWLAINNIIQKYTGIFKFRLQFYVQTQPKKGENHFFEIFDTLKGRDQFNSAINQIPLHIFQQIFIITF